MITEIKRMSDLQAKLIDTDEQVKIEALLNQDMEFVDFVYRTGKTGTFLVIAVKDPESKRLLSFSCGGKVIMDKLAFAKSTGNFPIIGKIIKVKSYYDII